MKTINNTEFQSFKNELEKVAVNQITYTETSHCFDGTKIEETYTEFTTPLNKVCFCEYKTVREQGILCLVISN